MGYETNAFGSADGSNVTQTVNTHFGAREVGNAEGVYPSDSAHREAAMNFDGETIDLPVYLPENSYVVDIITVHATGAITTATVGGDDVSLADGTKANIAGPVSGELVIEGPTAGTVAVRYRHVA